MRLHERRTRGGQQLQDADFLQLDGQVLLYSLEDDRYLPAVSVHDFVFSNNSDP